MNSGHSLMVSRSPAIAPFFTNTHHQISWIPIWNLATFDFLKQFKIVCIRCFCMFTILILVRNHNWNLLSCRNDFIHAFIKMRLYRSFTVLFGNFCCAMRAIEFRFYASGIFFDSAIPKYDFLAAVWANEHIRPHHIIYMAYFSICIHGLIHPHTLIVCLLLHFRKGRLEFRQ